MLKKIIASLKLVLVAGKATAMPPIGPALGQYGVDISAFCKDYNLQTIKNLNTIIPVEITIFEDRSYSFILKTTPTSQLLLKYSNTLKGSSEPNKIIVGYITQSNLIKIAKVKMLDFNTLDIKKACLIILGTAKNMGIKLKKN